MAQEIAPFSTFFVKSLTATSDDPFRLEDNQALVLETCNIHILDNDCYYGNAISQPAPARADSVIWFEAPMRPFDLVFKNYTAGNNCTIIIAGFIKQVR